MTATSNYEVSSHWKVLSLRGAMLLLMLAFLSVMPTASAGTGERKGFASEPNDAGHRQFTCYALVRNARNNLPIAGAKIIFNWSWTGEDDFYLEEAWADAEGYTAFDCWDYSESKYIKVHEISAPGFVTDNTVRSFYIPDVRTQYYYLNPREPGTEEVTHPIPHLTRQLWSNTASEREKASVELIARGTAAVPELMADFKKHSYTSDGKYEFPDYPSNIAILEILKEIAKTSSEYLRKDDYIYLIGEAYHRGSSLTFRTLAASVLRQIGGKHAQVLLGEVRQTDPVTEAFFCPKCGRKMQPEWSYCPYDGTRLIQTPESR